MKPTLTEQVSKGIEQSLFKQTAVKRDWRVCPNCKQRGVSRDARRCGNCGKRLLFDGDDASNVVDDFFLWHRSVFNFEGYYHRSFFTTEPLIK
jgi:hypothetical protein